MKTNKHFANRIEWALWLLMFSLSRVLNLITAIPSNLSCFLTGAFMGMGVVFIFISLLPQETYDNLLYRTWLSKEKK